MHGRYVAPKLGEGDQNEEAEDGNSTEKSTNDKENSSESEKIRNSLEQQAAERMRNLKRATTIFFCYRKIEWIIRGSLESTGDSFVLAGRFLPRPMLTLKKLFD